MPDLDLVFAALADRTRRSILTMLLEGDRPVGALAEPFEMSLAAVSKHLQILTRAGLITAERRGREKWCALNPDGIAAAGQWIGNFGGWTTEDLDRIEAALGPLFDE